jgi:hypothetical protein
MMGKTRPPVSAPPPDACLWCGEAFQARTNGGTTQRFCKTAHRRAFDHAARVWVRRAIERGILTVAQLRGVARTARALPGDASDHPADPVAPKGRSPP